jgi:hypothetical protein
VKHCHLPGNLDGQLRKLRGMEDVLVIGVLEQLLNDFPDPGMVSFLYVPIGTIFGFL